MVNATMPIHEVTSPECALTISRTAYDEQVVLSRRIAGLLSRAQKVRADNHFAARVEQLFATERR